MRVLVWKSYGEINLYEVSTPEQVAKIFKTVKDILESWHILELNLKLSEMALKPLRMNKIINLVEDFGEDTNDFERFFLEEVSQ